MNAPVILAAVNALVEMAKEVPELVAAIEGVFSALRSKQDPSPAIKHLEAVAAAKSLGIDYD